jgi:hypothetical protein
MSTDQREIVAAGQPFGVDREHGQDHEHAEQAQTEYARETQARAQFESTHAVALGHGRDLERIWQCTRGPG